MTLVLMDCAVDVYHNHPGWLLTNPTKNVIPHKQQYQVHSFIYNSLLLFLKIISELCVCMQINSTMSAQWLQCTEDMWGLWKLLCTDVHEKCGGTTHILSRKSDVWSKGHLLPCFDTTEADFTIYLDVAFPPLYER